MFITPAGVLRGKAGIRTAFTQLLADMPNAELDLKTQIFQGDVLFLEWAADAQRHRSRRRHRHVRVLARADPVQTVRYRCRAADS